MGTFSVNSVCPLWNVFPRTPMEQIKESKKVYKRNVWDIVFLPERTEFGRNYWVNFILDKCKNEGVRRLIKPLPYPFSAYPCMLHRSQPLPPSLLFISKNAEVDECSDDQSCEENAVCMHTQRSYRCSCKDGYSRQGTSCIGRHTNTLSWHTPSTRRKTRPYEFLLVVKPAWKNGGVIRCPGNVVWL